MLKLSDPTATVKEKPKQAPRCVGYITHEVNIRGPDQPKPSRKLS